MKNENKIVYVFLMVALAGLECTSVDQSSASSTGGRILPDVTSAQASGQAQDAVSVDVNMKRIKRMTVPNLVSGSSLDVTYSSDETIRDLMLRQEDIKFFLDGKYLERIVTIASLEDDLHKLRFMRYNLLDFFERTFIDLLEQVKLAIEQKAALTDFEHVVLAPTGTDLRQDLLTYIKKLENAMEQYCSMTKDSLNSFFMQYPSRSNPSHTLKFFCCPQSNNCTFFYWEEPFHNYLDLSPENGSIRLRAQVCDWSNDEDHISLDIPVPNPCILPEYILSEFREMPIDDDQSMYDQEITDLNLEALD